MKILSELWAKIWGVRTTAFGYVQVILGVLATATDVLTHDVLKFVVLVNGLITACIGHYNQSVIKKQNQQEP